MAVVADERTYTPEDLLALPDDRSFELVNGRLVEKEMGAESAWVGRRISTLLGVLVDDKGLGWVFADEGSYQCFPEEPGRVRRPDVSYIRPGRLPGERLPKGHLRIAPDLAVEVVSPNDSHSELLVKVFEYLRAGVRLVWVAEAETRTVEIIPADGSVDMLKERGELTGEDVLPEFRCPVTDLFPPRATASSAPEVNP